MNEVEHAMEDLFQTTSCLSIVNVEEMIAQHHIALAFKIEQLNNLNHSIEQGVSNDSLQEAALRVEIEIRTAYYTVLLKRLNFLVEEIVEKL
jgi:hypothetical protein